jgi:hypothetical protein
MTEKQEMTEAFEMDDDEYSRFVREARNLDPNWRVYEWRTVGTEKVRLTGAIARPAGKYDDRRAGSPVWFRPMRGKAQMTLTYEQYRKLADRLKP